MSSTVAQNESRRIQRIALPLPARIEVKLDSKASWNEMVRLEDISAFGAGFSLTRPVKRGRLLMMMLPMPRQLRCYDHSESQYRVWALVRRCIPITNGDEPIKYMVGVAFVGKNAPSSFFADPTHLYDISHRGEEGIWHIVDADSGGEDPEVPKDQRRQTRFFIPETIMLEAMNGENEVSDTEYTVTENVSVGGAAVFTSLNVETGAFIRMTCLRNDVKIISIVRAKRKGPDGLTRLHLEFVDRHFPLEGIE